MELLFWFYFGIVLTTLFALPMILYLNGKENFNSGAKLLIMVLAGETMLYLMLSLIYRITVL